MCLQNTWNNDSWNYWNDFNDDGTYTYNCSNSEHFCDLWDKDMKRCCPETCNSTSFTKEACEKSNMNGTCVYPFRARYGDCYRYQTSKEMHSRKI